jgi:phytoene dehydrogenase-like protein
LVPDTPLKPYRPRVKEQYDVVVIGSGLGGLMAAAALAQAGQSVAVFEKLGFPGGRYTEIEYKGAAVTTGAWTNLGPNSHIDRFLTRLGIQLDYVSLREAGLTEQYSIRIPDGRHYASLFDLLTRPARKAWLKAIVDGKKHRAGSLDQISVVDYITQYSDDPDLLAAVNAIAATASGLPATRMPASEYIQITLDGREAGHEFAMPRGGVRSIIKALVSTLRQAGGELFVRSPVAEIVVESSPSEPVAGGISLADGREIRSRVVLHNGGPGRFIDLIGAVNLPPEYLATLRSLQGVECAALFCATNRPLFSDAPITMTPGCRRVVGIFSPTVLDPNLSRNGLFLYDAFLPTYSDDLSAELRLTLADMGDLFPEFEQVVEWTVPMFFTGAWPGTESGQTFGQTGEHRLDPVTPIQNCFMVGMDVKGSGVAGDLIPLGVQRVLNYILERK